ncbi:MAG TPA: transglycosylase SLT domain-containing protein [Verrucomicrobiae bacterium]|jgi:membrane-bound lytic murein transglycosylase D|nr:transglycosylase SLT domain-containing protein [Verrucomicrobiae bacterium]
MLFTGALSAFGQTNTVTIDDLMQSAQQWANDNLDENVLQALQNTDQEKVRQFFDSLQKNFQGEYVIDLAQLRDTAKTILPLLDSSEETAPYAAWLETRMDYLDTAEELRLRIPPPKIAPGLPPAPPFKPAPELVREIWIKKISTRPPPNEAKPYVSTLKPIFAQQKVPTQLVWVAEVESSFNPDARSPVGATGLFQLMPDTANRFGLRTWPLDQRLDPEPSARAAATYLGVLHEKFKDWRLALAAYNAGEGTVQNLLKRHHATTYDAIASHLPAETQMFVPKVEATLQKREGMSLSELP